MQTVSRLFQAYQPNHYSLTLRLNEPERSFEGVVAIDGRLQQAADSITLHAVGLEISASSLNGAHATSDQSGDELTIRAKAEMPAGDVRIEISFSGTITDAMHGIYPATFHHEGKKETILATQFESHHAREAFPCIDEPEAKATFDLTLVTAGDITVLGNMPTSRSERSDDQLTTAFETTPRMSTYLLAFVAGPLHGVHGMTKNGTEVNVWTAPNQPLSSLDFALQTAISATEFFNDYFETPYPLPKCDHVALPDFSSAAMENWGLITYREACLLVDPKTTSIATKEFTATVISHEISHQWFGNLVTMKWWDDLWLNESFATLMEYLAVDALHPDWDIWMTFASHEGLSALRRDALAGVQAVKADVNHPDEISTLFDGAIVYAKGARLLNMLYRYVGDAAFRQGLKTYFKEHSYGNTTGSDLWKALEAASSKPISQLMTAWLEKPGYPVVFAHQDGTTLRLRQERFLTGGTTEDQALWPIPLLANTQQLSDVRLDQEHAVFQLESEQIVRLNSSGSGHYTVRYETADQQQAIATAISNGELSPTERLLALNDSTMQARANIGSAVETLRLLQSFETEASEPVWDMISLVIADMRRLIEDDDEAERDLKALIRRLISAQYERLGWQQVKGEPASDTKLRATIIGLGSYADDKAITEEALRRYRATDDLMDMPAELRPILLSVAIKTDEPGALDRLLKEYAETPNAELQQDIAAGLTSTRSEETARRLLGLALDGTIRLQDVDRWFVYLLRNKYTRETAWGWMVEQWPWIERNFGHDKSYENYPRYAANVLATQEWLERFTTFFRPLADIPALKRVIEVGILDIASRSAWRERDRELLKNFLLSL